MGRLQQVRHDRLGHASCMSKALHLLRERLCVSCVANKGLVADCRAVQ